MRASAVLLAFVLATPVLAQLRVVTYNTLDGPDSPADADFQTIFSAIAASSVNGIAKRPDIVMLQEQTFGPPNSTDNLATLLNGLYGVSTYVAVQPNQMGGDRLGYVYDSASLEPIGPPVLVLSGGTRPHLRGQFRRAGYTSPAANFYVYSSHLNAASASTRATEAASLRANTDSLGAGTHAITTGDYNIQSSGTQAYQNLTAAGGPGRLFDPINRPGVWNNNPAFADIHTQSTRFNDIGDGGATGGMDDRFDFQLVTSPLLDGEGLSYIGPTAPGTGAAHSYRAFGNAGNTFNGNINDPPNNSPLTSALHFASDHLPVIADYQIPARMAVSVAQPPPEVIIDTQPQGARGESRGRLHGAVRIARRKASLIDLPLPGEYRWRCAATISARSMLATPIVCRRVREGNEYFSVGLKIDSRPFGVNRCIRVCSEYGGKEDQL